MAKTVPTKIIPTSVSLMGKKIPITVETLTGDYRHAWACFWPGKMAISINTTCPVDIVQDALLHELVHAVLEISGLTNLLPLEQEEAICRALENLTSVYKLK